MSRTTTDRQRRRLLLAAAPWALAGCTLGSSPRRDFYLLRDANAQAPVPPGPAIDKVLLLASSAMPGLYDSDRMVFSADGRSRSYFQFGYWSERPAQSLLLLAETRLVNAQRFRAVASSTSGVRGDLLLTLRLDEIYLDTASTPQRVSLAVTAELIDWGQRRLIARRTFRQFAAVAQGGAAEFADAASDALGRMLGELVDWTVQSSR